MPTTRPDTPGTPDPLDKLFVSRTTWLAGRRLHRIYREIYPAHGFNPGGEGNARFSPITDRNGRAISTLYAGSTFDCAAMETVFHDVPFAPGFKSFDKTKLVGQVYSVLEVKIPLVLADLSTVALRKLGVSRSALIDTEADRYPATRRWAQAIHAQCPDVQGLRWISRQDDRADALLLFGDRISRKKLVGVGASRNLLADIPVYAELLNLAQRIGVAIIDGRGGLRTSNIA